VSGFTIASRCRSASIMACDEDRNRILIRADLGGINSALDGRAGTLESIAQNVTAPLVVMVVIAVPVVIVVAVVMVMAVVV
jgi:hypothetical protein